MKENTSRFKPAGWYLVTPRIVAKDARRLVTFLAKVFDARGTYRADRPSEIRIRLRSRRRQDVSPRHESGRALEEPFDMPYGDRRCIIEDRWGNTWQIATRLLH